METGPVCSQLGVSGFTMEAGWETLHCGIYGLDGWVQTSCEPRLFLVVDWLLRSVTIRGAGWFGHYLGLALGQVETGLGFV